MGHAPRIALSPRPRQLHRSGTGTGRGWGSPRRVSVARAVHVGGEGGVSAGDDAGGAAAHSQTLTFSFSTPRSGGEVGPHRGQRRHATNNTNAQSPCSLLLAAPLSLPLSIEKRDVVRARIRRGTQYKSAQETGTERGGDPIAKKQVLTALWARARLQAICRAPYRACAQGSSWKRWRAVGGPSSSSRSFP